MGRTRHYRSNADRQRAYRRRLKHRATRRETLAGSNMDKLRAEALRRFEIEPSKCFQRHIREVRAEHDLQQPIDYSRAHVSQISNIIAKELIRRYEWLGTMAAGTCLSYGLWPSNELYWVDDLLGAVCFAKGGNRAALASVVPNYDKAMILARGACTLSAGRNGASFLISRACKLAARDWGITHFLAYSDPEAGEIGTIYKALGWQCLGISKQGKKVAFESPTGERISSYGFSKRNDGHFYRLGWDGVQGKYDFLRSLGWREVPEAPKVRWLHVQKTDEPQVIRHTLMNSQRHKFAATARQSKS